MTPNPTVNVIYALPAPRCQVGYFTNASTGEVVPARCGAWACPECGPRKVRRFAARVRRARGWSYFITLTLEGAAAPDCETIRYINRCWRTFKRWLQRNACVKNWVWVNEVSPRGRLHKHAMVACSRFDYSRARDAVVRAGFGSVCDFQRVRGAVRVASYIAKYLSKTLPRGAWPRYARRCQTSVPEARPEDVWLFKPKRLQPRITWQKEAVYDREKEWRNAEAARAAAAWSPQLDLALIQEEKVRHWRYENGPP